MDSYIDIRLLPDAAINEAELSSRVLTQLRRLVSLSCVTTKALASSLPLIRGGVGWGFKAFDYFAITPSQPPPSQWAELV